MKSKFKGTANATMLQLMATIFLKWLDCESNMAETRGRRQHHLGQPQGLK